MFLVEMFHRKTTMPTPAEALAGRAEPIETAPTHFVSGRPLKGPFGPGRETAFFAMGRFWGAERLFWSVPGVEVTAAGFAGGYTPNPTSQEVMTSLTGHAETVMVVFDPAAVSYRQLLKLFFESHDPTQAMRQGNDIGTAYRSAIFSTSAAQLNAANAMREAYQSALKAAGHSGRVMTEIIALSAFYYAEPYHQQHLARNPGAHPGPKGTGVACPIA